MDIRNANGRCGWPWARRRAARQRRRFGRCRRVKLALKVLEAVTLPEVDVYASSLSEDLADEEVGEVEMRMSVEETLLDQGPVTEENENGEREGDSGDSEGEPWLERRMRGGMLDGGSEDLGDSGGRQESGGRDLGDGRVFESVMSAYQ